MAVVLAAILWLLYPAADVTLRDGESGRLFACWSLPPGTPFQLAYTHSMYGGDVRETFLVTAGSELRRVDFRAERAAAADYYAATASVWPVDGWHRVDVAPASFPELAIRVDAVGAPRIIANGLESPLLPLAGSPRQVILTPRSLVGSATGACA